MRKIVSSGKRGGHLLGNEEIFLRDTVIFFDIVFNNIHHLYYVCVNVITFTRTTSCECYKLVFLFLRFECFQVGSCNYCYFFNSFSKRCVFLVPLFKWRILF